MKFIKYLLSCFTNAIDASVCSASAKKRRKEDAETKRKGVIESFVFILELLIFIGIFALWGFGVFNKVVRNDVLVWVYTMLATVATILTFCLISILVEAVINLFIKKAAKNKED